MLGFVKLQGRSGIAAWLAAGALALGSAATPTVAASSHGGGGYHGGSYHGGSYHGGGWYGGRWCGGGWWGGWPAFGVGVGVGLVASSAYYAPSYSYYYPYPSTYYYSYPSYYSTPTVVSTPATYSPGVVYTAPSTSYPTYTQPAQPQQPQAPQPAANQPPAATPPAPAPQVAPQDQSPPSSTGHYQDRELGDAYLRMGDFPNAARVYQRYLSAWNGDGTVTRNLGLALIGKGDAARGLKLVSQGYRLEPTLFDRPLQPNDAGGPTNFQKLLDATTSAASGNNTPDGWFALAMMYQAMGNRDSAITALQKARDTGLDTTLLDAATLRIAGPAH